jgi:hypothetical protein
LSGWGYYFGADHKTYEFAFRNEQRCRSLFRFPKLVLISDTRIQHRFEGKMKNKGPDGHCLGLFFLYLIFFTIKKKRKISVAENEKRKWER